MPIGRGRRGHAALQGPVPAGGMRRFDLVAGGGLSDRCDRVAEALLSNWSGTARKLFLGFGALVLVCAASSYLTLAGLGRIHAALDQIDQEEERVRLALELASAVRDQYAHQAHTIIIGDESHLGLYGQAQGRVLALTKELRGRVQTGEEQALVGEIDAASGELDAIFRRRIVPAVLRGDRAFVRAEHARAQLVVTRIQERAEALVRLFEARIVAARAEASRVVKRTSYFIYALLVGTPLLAAAVTYSVGRSIARPIGKLREGAQRLGSGDLDTHIDVYTPDEFGALAQQFNAMTAALKEHQSKLLQSEKLAGVGRLAAGVAHEINNPLGVILGYVRLMRKRADAATDADLAVIEEETLRCKEIVAGLLDLSRPQRAGSERVELRALADEVVARLREAKLLDGVGVEVAGAASARGHPSQLQQVLSNLIRNAAEAAGPGGRVTVEVEGGAEEVRVAVRDTGRGLDATARDRLFEPFFTTKDRGTGLGLALSRAIARAHGGDIEAAGAHGEGAVFTLRLPRQGGAP
jgi:two-component system NtrC family sensor kinase